jgi:hypothetical protein
VKNKTPFIFILFTAVSLISIFTIEVHADEPVAMITDLSGKAVIMENGNKAVGDILSTVTDGNKIKLDAGSTLVLVFFNSSKEYTFSDKATITINEDYPKVESGQKLVQKNLNLTGNTKLTPPKKAYKQAAIVFRGARKKSKIKLISPIKSNVMDANITFKWKPIEENIQYRFTLTDEIGKSLVETLVTGTKFKIPGEIALKEDTYYSWQVEARLSSGSVYSNSTNFIIIADEEKNEINKSRPADGAPFSERLIFAMLLEQKGLKVESSKYWHILAGERPGNKKLQSRLK